MSKTLRILTHPDFTTKGAPLSIEQADQNMIELWSGVKDNIETIESDTNAVIYAPEPPTTRETGKPLVEGDIWVDTDDGNRIYVWNDTSETWEPLDERITLNASAITDLDTRVTVNENDITVNASAITAAETDIDNLETDVSANSSSISTLESESAIYDADLANAQYQADPPSNRPSGEPLEIGDTWIETDNDNRVYIWDGSSWTKGDQLIDTNASNIQSAESNIGDLQTDTNHVFRQNTEPTQRPSGNALKEGDKWVDTDGGNRVYSYDGTNWVVDNDAIDNNASSILDLDSRVTVNEGDIDANASAILSAESDISNLQTDSNHTFRQDGSPSQRPSGESLVVGDVWIETDNNDTQHYWDGSSWVIADATASLNLDSRVSTNDGRLDTVEATAVLKVDASGNIASVALTANHDGTSIDIAADQINFDVNAEINEGADVIIGKNLSGQVGENTAVIGLNSSTDTPLVRVQSADSGGGANFVEMVGRSSGNQPVFQCVVDGSPVFEVNRDGVADLNVDNGGRIVGTDIKLDAGGIQMLSDGGDYIKWVDTFDGAINAAMNFNTGSSNFELYSNDDLVLTAPTGDSRLTAGAEVFISGNTIDLNTSNLGFYGVTPQSRQSLSGSSFGGSQVLKDLVVILGDMGLINNQTTP